MCRVVVSGHPRQHVPPPSAGDSHTREPSPHRSPGTPGSRFRFDLNPACQSRELARRGCDCGVGSRGPEIKHVDDRAADVFLPGKDYQVIADSDCLVLDGIGEADTALTRNYFHGQLAFGVNGDLRREGPETDLEHQADERPGCGF